MEFKHKSVLLKESIEALQIKPDGIYVDGTLGGGGHSYEICRHLSDKGRLIGIDQDAAAIEAAKERLGEFGDKVTIIRSNYCNMVKELKRIGISSADGIILDLGVSSYQLDTAERGFTYREDAPLDMRMDQRQDMTAKDIVNGYSEMELYRIIRDYGEEKFAKNIAKHIVNARQQKEIETIRERKITVKLSDADCDRLARKCGEHGLTIGELIENFVGDLVGGTYSNGSDERDYADQWFERCWFGMFPEPTLLNHLLNLGYEPEHYLDMLENVETIKSDIEITKQNIAEPSDEWKDIVYHKYNDDRTSYECVPCYNSVDEYIASEKEDLESYKADLEEALEELKDMRADWKPEKEPNMDEEIELIKKWVKEREDFINE